MTQQDHAEQGTPESCTCPRGTRVHLPYCPATYRTTSAQQCMGSDQRPEDIAKVGTNGAEWIDCGDVATWTVTTSHMGTWHVCERHISHACEFGGTSAVAPYAAPEQNVERELVEQLDASTWDELISIRTNGSGWIAAVDANGRTLAVRDVSDIDDENAHDSAIMDLLGDALDVVSAQ